MAKCVSAIVPRLRAEKVAPPHPGHGTTRLVSKLHSDARRRSRLRLLSFGRRSRFKKFCKERAGMPGVKIKRGSALDAQTAAQCPRCDRGQHRRCIRGFYCAARERSPPGCCKRSTERAAKRVEKQAKRGISRQLFDDSSWRPIDGFWIARRLDGDNGRYEVAVPVAAFGDRLPLGGEARFTEGLGGDAERVFPLPEAAPPADGELKFRVEAAAEGMCLVAATGLEVRARVCPARDECDPSADDVLSESARRDRVAEILFR